MDTGRAQRIEAAVEAAAAMLFAAAVAYVLTLAGVAPVLRLAASALACASAFYTLRAVQPAERGYTLPAFAIGPVDAAPVDELLLTEADRVQPDELLLDRALAHIGPESRVVRLFAPAGAAATTGEPKARPAADASKAMLEALTKLRRSIR
jgi:hypothetical protein